MATQKCARILAAMLNWPNKSAVPAAICAISRKCAQKFPVADDHRVAGACGRLLTETDGAVS